MFKEFLKEQKKDPVGIQIQHVILNAISNIKMGYNKSRETIIRHSLDYLRHSKKSPINKEEILDFEQLLADTELIKNS